ncbi:CvpA family protein [Lonepinella sp. BR2882]|uniref:CvpA family protein n=1 Tax=Lonepinella sp. BR2882 TaxID=3095283 RepID=UPI003F6E335E
MSVIDYIIIGIIVFSVIVSLLRGFVREVLSLASWIIAFIVASQFYPYLANLLTQIESEYIRNGVAIGVLFVLTLIVGGIVNYVISQLVDKTGLSGTDRVLGACFGFLRGVLIVAALLFFVDTFTNLDQGEAWKSSQLIPHFGFVVEWFFQQLQANSSFLNSTLTSVK